MTVVEGPKSVSLVERAQNMLLKPAAEWDVIEAEPATIQGLYTGYIMILAAIPAVATLVGAMLMSHWGIVPAVVDAVLTYALALVGIYVIAFIINALAPSFGAQQNQIQAMKLVTYSYTATWVAGVFYIVPPLGVLAVLVGGIYALYTMYHGLPKMMKSPADKTMGYFAVSLLVAFVVYLVLAIVVSMIIGILVAGAAVTGAVAAGGLAN